MVDVAEAVGLVFNTISKLETGQQQVTPKHLSRFAEFFECEPRDLLPTSSARAELDASVAARDADGVLVALASLGIDLPRRLNPSDAPTQEQPPTAQVDAMLVRQLRAVISMLEQRPGVAAALDDDKPPSDDQADAELSPHCRHGPAPHRHPPAEQPATSHQPRERRARPRRS